MKIQFHNVLPKGIPPPKEPGTVWNCETGIDTAGHHLVRGASGRGKSTFLHLLHGIRRDYEGTIEFEGADIQEFSNDRWAQLRQRQVAMLFQDLRLIAELTARENLLLKTRLSANSLPEQIPPLAERLGIAEHLDKPCALLSYGQQQRLALLRALLQPFELLLLDEPFSHLDPANTQTCMELIREVCAENGAGILLATLDADYGLEHESEIQV